MVFCNHISKQRGDVMHSTVAMVKRCYAIHLVTLYQEYIIKLKKIMYS